jgi:hypothetical protein
VKRCTFCQRRWHTDAVNVLRDHDGRGEIVLLDVGDNIGDGGRVGGHAMAASLESNFVGSVKASMSR